jgi:hypothetical protein
MNPYKTNGSWDKSNIFLHGNHYGHHNTELKTCKLITWTARTPLRQVKKTGNRGELRCSGRVSSHFSTSEEECAHRRRIPPFPAKVYRRITRNVKDIIAQLELDMVCIVVKNIVYKFQNNWRETDIGTWKPYFSVKEHTLMCAQV